MVSVPESTPPLFKLSFREYGFGPQHSYHRQHCSESIPVTAELFGDDLSKQVKDISEVNRVGRKVKTTTFKHRLQSHSLFG